jgi:uridine kinase
LFSINKQFNHILQDQSARILFFLGLSIKLIFMIFAQSPVMSSYFYPFLSFFVESGFSNPYTFFLESDNKEAFPYPAGMLFLLAIPQIISSFFDLNQAFAIGVLKIPLLLADLGILLIVSQWVLNKKHIIYFLILYWLSPVTIFISYIHGQLDVIPIFFLIVSLNLLFKKKYLGSAALIGFSLATKTMILILIPLLFSYLLVQKFRYRQIFLFGLTLLSAFMVINLPFFFQPGLFEVVFQNSEQGKLFSTFLKVDDLEIFIIPFIYLIVFVISLNIFSYSRDLFLMFIGFAFATVLSFVIPSPGWYFWVVPFLAYFFSKFFSKVLIFFILQICYLGYFASSGIINIPFLEFIELNESLMFTLMQACMVINSYLIFKYGFSTYSNLKLFSRPLLIGIGGDSGSGKTTLANNLKNLVGSEKTLILKGDDTHKWERGDENWEKMTHLNPKANYLYEDINNLNNIKNGKAIYRKEYDHQNGKFTDYLRLSSKNLLIYEGLHPFFLSHQRKLFDIKIFLKPEEELQLDWKVERDVGARGHDYKKVMDQISKRKTDKNLYIDSQVEYSDIILRAFRIQDQQDEILDIGYEMFLPNSIYTEKTINAFEKSESLQIAHEYVGTESQKITLIGKPESDFLNDLEERLIPELSELQIKKTNWPDSLFSVVLFFIVYSMLFISKRN